MVVLAGLLLSACATVPGPAVPTDPEERSAAPPPAVEESPAPPDHQGPGPVETAIESAINTMDLEAKVGQMIVPGIVFAADGAPLVRLDARAAALLEDVQPGGFILFGPNIRDAEQLRSLVGDLQGSTVLPMIIATDQEGGVVTRIRPGPGMPVTELPSPEDVGYADDPSLTFQLGRLTGQELAALGISMNFAPVADVLTRPDNPVIRGRSFGSDPQSVSTMVAAYVRGLQSSGVSAVVKHFPGHGDTADDSHDVAISLDHSLERLFRIELPPFRAAIDAGVDGVLTAHIALPEISQTGLPATLDARILTGVLRERLGFDGLIVTDSLIMGAVSGVYSERDIALRAVDAGVDLLLRPARPRLTRDLIVQAVREGRIDETRIDQSVRRILGVKVLRGQLLVVDGGLEAAQYSALVPSGAEIADPGGASIVAEIVSRARRARATSTGN